MNDRKRLTLFITDETYRRFRVACAAQDKNMTEVAEELFNQYAKKEKQAVVTATA